jgi:hypothetical protein
VLRVLLTLTQEEEAAGYEPFVGRGRALLQRAPAALAGFFRAYLGDVALEKSPANQFYVFVQFRDARGQLQNQRLRADAKDRLENLRLPADTTVVIRWLHPATLQTAVSALRTGASGTRTQIPPTIWNEQIESAGADSDGLPDVGELVVGTSPTNPDTDGDELPDGIEIRGGTNPLDGFVASPGV